MQHNPIPIRTPFVKSMTDLKDSYFKEEKKQHVVASLFIKGKEGGHSTQHKIMAHIGREAEHLEESSGENEVEVNMGNVDIPKEEEDPFEIFPGDWWIGSVERNNFFSKLHNKLTYLQECLPYLKAMEKDPRYAKVCNGPSSSKVESIIQQYVPTK